MAARETGVLPAKVAEEETWAEVLDLSQITRTVAFLQLLTNHLSILFITHNKKHLLCGCGSLCSFGSPNRSKQTRQPFFNLNLQLFNNFKKMHLSIFVFSLWKMNPTPSTILKILQKQDVENEKLMLSTIFREENVRNTFSSNIFFFFWNVWGIFERWQWPPSCMTPGFTAPAIWNQTFRLQTERNWNTMKIWSSPAEWSICGSAAGEGGAVASGVVSGKADSHTWANNRNTSRC